MLENNKFVSMISRYEEDIFLAILLLFSLSFFLRSLLSLEGMSRTFPMLFSGILLASTSLLLGYKFLTGRVLDRLSSSTDESTDREEVDYYPIVLVVLMFVLIAIGNLVNLAVGAIVFVLLYSITRQIDRRKTAVLLAATLGIIYVFVFLINSPIL